MSNLNQTQAKWNKAFRELGVFLGPIKQLRDLKRKFTLGSNRTQIVEQNSVNGFTSAWTLSGVETPTNTDETGTIFVRMTKDSPGAGTTTIDLYKAAGGGGSDKVATGTVANAGGTCTLAAANSSGLTGTVTVGAVSASESDDKHRLQVFQDWPLRSRAIFNNSEPEHADESSTFTDACKATSRQIDGAISAWIVAATIFLQGRFADFMGSSSSTSPITKTATNLNGAVTTTYTGVLEDARKNMVDELNAGMQKVVRNTITASSPSFDSQNQGQGAASAPTMAQWARDGVITLVCTDSTIGSEQFQVTQRPTTPATQNEIITASQPLQIKQAYADPIIGIASFILNRLLSFSAGGASTDFGAASGWTINGEKSTNTNSGSIYCKITASGGGSVTSKVAIGAGAASKTFIFSYQNGATTTITTGVGSTTAALVAADLNANTTFAANFTASATLADGTGTGTYLTIALKSTADGSYGLVTSGTLNGQGGTGQDTFNNNTTVGKFRIDGYKSTTYASSDQVFTSTTGTTGSTVTISQANSSGITGAAVIGTQPVSGNTATLSLNTFTTQNANNVSDKITITITSPNSARGEFQDRLAEVFGYGLNSSASGSQTIDEGYVTCGTFPPYSVRDA